MSENDAFPYWFTTTQSVADRISPTHVFEISIADIGCNIILYSQDQKRFRLRVDQAMMDTENFRMVVDHFLQDGMSSDDYDRFISKELIAKLETLKIELVLRHTPNPYLHCGSIETHASHIHHTEGKFHICHGWMSEWQ